MNHKSQMNIIKSNYSLQISPKTLMIIFITALILRVIFMVILESWLFSRNYLFGFEIGDIARWLADGKGFITIWNKNTPSPSATYPPIYPLIMGGAFYIFGTFSKAAAISLFLFQSVCAAISAVCLAVLGNKLFNRTAGLIAGFAWSVFPGSVFFSVKQIWYSEIEVMLILFLIIVTISVKQSNSFRRIFLQGFLCGLLILTDSAMIIYPVFLLAWILISLRLRPAMLFLFFSIWLITTIGVISPWMMHNWYVFGTLNVTKSNLGQELFTGNNPFSTGLNRSSEIVESFKSLDVGELNYYKNQSEVAYYKYLQNKALEWIRENPHEFFSLTVKRIWYFWVLNPKLGKASWFRLVYFGPFLLLAMLGFKYIYQRLWDLAPVWLFLLAYPLPYYVTHVAHGRYFYPVESLVVLLGAITLAQWLKCYSCDVSGQSQIRSLS
jgi:4-amino-4-deoxy-L-arabinose transferase-like glycosyltransferase